MEELGTYTAPERTQKYFNRMQREVMLVQANKTYVVAARGTGKSEGIDAPFVLRNVWAMPGSTGALISPSYAKAWGNTLPALINGLKMWGYYPEKHYYIGRRAPEHANFAKPKREPLRDAWSNSVHFWNGTVMLILSFSNAMSANSMSLDWLIAPEAKFLDHDKIKSEVNPANRGNIDKFGYSPFHHSELYTTDMPTNKAGRWILNQRESMSPEHINLIKTLYQMREKYRKIEPHKRTEWEQRQYRELTADINGAREFQPVQKEDPLSRQKREFTVFYGEYDVLENLEILGEDFIWQMKRDNPPLIWRTAFLNERLFKVANGFYSALDENIHFYIPKDVREVYGLNFDADDCLNDDDLQTLEPLHIAFDANAAISSACVGQKDGDKMLTLKSFFVKTPDKLPELCAKIGHYYRNKINREIVFYFDHSFVWEDAKDDESYADTITRCLTDAGFKVTQVYMGQITRHDWRHKEIDRALKGDTELLFPLFNEYNNEFLKIAMEQTGVKPGKNGFEKDKSPEKTADSPEDPDEHKTHITDAWDNLFVGMNYHYTEPSHSSVNVAFLGKQ
ncbi:MAG: hypothetical protein PHS04_07135 [Tissierellia bacterium]|nr:hypothetical protein [Tissierellia bacterium]